MRPYLLIFCLLASQLVLAQDPFTVRWSFEGNSNGASSVGYVTPSGAGFSGVNLLAVAPYSAGQVGQAANVQNWSTAVCNNTEYVEFSIQPNRGQTMTLNQFSFYVSRSAQGPVNVSVRSSADGFAGDLYNGSITATAVPYNQVSVGLSGGAFTNVSGAITFRIYACNPISGGGTIRLDEVVISGVLPRFPLPVSLLYFRTQPQPDNRVVLSWATTWERDADRFEVQRSRSLSEFGTIGQIPARGTTQTRQLYTFSDDWPDAGTTYYRLRQVDTDGTATYSNIVAAVLDDNTPTLSVLDSEMPGTIRVRGRNLSGALFSVVSTTGQVIPVTVQTEGNGSIALHGKLGIGLYVVRAAIGSTQLVQRALVR